MSKFHMGRVALTVHDLGKVSDWYQSVVGLQLLESAGEMHSLGVGGRSLIELRKDTAARRAGPREAGLFHSAFLLPSRGDLAHWVRHAIAAQIEVAGASDHLVSEALYLTDPEGNGVEIYADRPRAQWAWKDGEVVMDTIALDVPSLLALPDQGRWQGFEAGTLMGHVHLKVGDLARAKDFYSGILGVPVTSHFREAANFYGADGYHHHLATNIWQSRGAGARDLPSTGLAEVAIHLDGNDLAKVRTRAGAPEGGDLVLQDPWNNKIALHAF